MEARKCPRCGCMYISATEVCEKCSKRDSADIYRLRGFVESQEIGEGISQSELSIATGISNKNLTRFLEYDEFKGVLTGDIAQDIDDEEGFIEL